MTFTEGFCEHVAEQAACVRLKGRNFVEADELGSKGLARIKPAGVSNSRYLRSNRVHVRARYDLFSSRGVLFGRVLGLAGESGFFSRNIRSGSGKGRHIRFSRAGLPRNLATFSGTSRILHSKRNWTSMSSRRRIFAKPRTAGSRRSSHSPVAFSHLTTATPRQSSSRVNFAWSLARKCQRTGCG